MTVSECRVVFHGGEHAQYFQGHNVAYTKYTDGATGAGDSYLAALDDALEQLASGDLLPPDEMLREAVKAECGLTIEELEERVESDTQDLHSDCPSEESEHEGCGLYYYVSIDVVRSFYYYVSIDVVRS